MGHRLKYKAHFGRNYHHLTPRSRQGSDAVTNIGLWQIERHEAWHRQWGNKTIEEVYDILGRYLRMKHRTNLGEAIDTSEQQAGSRLLWPTGKSKNRGTGDE